MAGTRHVLNAEQHVVLFGAAAGLPRREARTTGMAMLESIGFPGGEKAIAKDLSGGTRQKLNLALALLGDPGILLLDEPYQGFDMGSYVDFWSHVVTWRDEGRAVVIVTHLLTEAHHVDRLIEVRDRGAHELAGAPHERSPGPSSSPEMQLRELLRRRADTFVVEGTDMRAELPGSAAARIDVDLPPGKYTFFCDVPGHEDVMQGVLYVN